MLSIANAKLYLNLSLFDEVGVNAYDDQPVKRDTIIDYSWLQSYHYNESYIEGITKLEKRLDIRECTTWVRGAATCIEDMWNGLKDIWEIAYEIKQLATYKSCTEIHGQIGGMYYRYWAAGGDCGTTAEQKTIAGAIYAAIKAQDGYWDCNIYCITMTHGGTWEGTLLIGPSASALNANCGGQFKGCYDAGCGALEGWYSCSS